ncbi:MAG: pyridoxal-phosphate dependent enzyme [Desulfurococcales archaeon]|nr:pyridoxal-phosphate dependent enzyme [Desulfurococcales archaeon]
MTADTSMWYCPKCGFVDSLRKYFWRCPKCGGPLDIMYRPRWEPIEGRRGMMRYLKALPPIGAHVTLGEGGTPTIVRDVAGIKVWFKLEYLNPTGSFKDRGASLAISLASELGFERVVEDTSGNTGIAVTAYSRIRGLDVTIVMPETAPQGKKILCKLLGANIIEAKSRGRAAKKVMDLINSKTFYVAHTWSPLFIEAAKTLAYEVYENGFRGNAVIVPVGSGGLMLGIYRGFRDLVNWGLLDCIPKIIAVQGTSVAPLYEEVHGSPPSTTTSSDLADGIMVPNPPRLKELKETVLESRGDVVLVDNDDIVGALRELLHSGFIVEPTSAAPYAALVKAVEAGLIGRGDEVLIPLTGSGLKTLKIFEALLST